MTANPRVTIIIPTYNSARWLAEAVDSALSQSFADMEVLVFDNASTDTTPQLMERYTDPRLVYRRYEENVGFAGNVTRGLKAARGEYMMVLGADDILERSFVETAVTRLDADSGAAMLHGGAVWIDDDGKPIGRFDGDWPSRSSGDDAFIRTFTQGFCYSCVFSRTAPVKALGAMDENWGMISDTWLFLRLCLAGDVLFVHEPLVRYRVRESSLSFHLYADGKMFNDHMGGLEDAFGWPQAAHLRSRKAEARIAVAAQSFDTMHMTRLGAGLQGMLSKTLEIVKAEPGVLGLPSVWARFAMALMPAWAIRTLRGWRRRRTFARRAELQGN
jgi:glycosyltransferase involved in cell wall biosynthesis